MLDDAILRINGVDARYGQAHVVQEATMHVGAECVTLMGRNGAGKTTLVRAILGLRPPRASGEVLLEGRPLMGLKPHAISRLGMGYVPQGRRLFPSLSVTEHLQVVARPPETGEGWTVDRIFDLFPQLAERHRSLGEQLSGGERSMLAIARALMTNPRCLILDEPTEGLAPTMVERVCVGLRDLVARGIPVLLVEQSLRAAELAGDRVYVMNLGRIVHESTVDAFMQDPETRDQFLGLSGIHTE